MSRRRRRRRVAEPGSQLDLFPLEPWRAPREATTAERFEAFHAANPHVYDSFVILARDLVRRGHRRVGIKALFERLRWLYSMKTSGDGDYKLNNNLAPHYARRIMEQNPDLQGVFETRKLQGEEP